MRGWITYRAEKNSYQFRSRSVGVRFEVLYDVSVMTPVVHESESEYRLINAMKRKNVLVNWPFPDRREFQKDLLCFLKVPRMDSEGFEGRRLVIQSPSPNIGGWARSDGDFSMFLKPLKQHDRDGEQSGVGGCGLLVAVSVRKNQRSMGPVYL